MCGGRKGLKEEAGRGGLRNKNDKDKNQHKEKELEKPLRALFIVLQAPLLFIQVHVRKGLCAGKSAKANAQKHKGEENAQEEPSAKH